MDSNLKRLYTEYTSTYPRPESVETEFCEAFTAYLESENLESAKYETQIRRLHECCEQKVEAKLVAEAVDCSVQYARRFSYSDEKGAFEKDWSKSTQTEKVSPGTRDRLITRDGRSCLRCGAENDLEVHHILPVSRGGTNDDSNLATLCSRCHKAAHGGSKTTGKTAYQEGKFSEWFDDSADCSGQKENPTKSRQQQISDYL